jgi:glyoxylase-like metal-dependent hydrolase (beta-lactamase superfamily II)
VQRREWEAGFDPDLARQNFLPKRYFDLGHKVQLVDGEHDLFGDGAVTCIPTYGHTPGHQSLRVRSAAGDHILVGDACYNAYVAENRHFPDEADPRRPAMNRSLDALLARREPQTVVVFGHDPEQWDRQPVLPSVRS